MWTNTTTTTHVLLLRTVVKECAVVHHLRTTKPRADTFHFGGEDTAGNACRSAQDGQDEKQEDTAGRTRKQSSGVHFGKKVVGLDWGWL